MSLVAVLEPAPAAVSGWLLCAIVSQVNCCIHTTVRHFSALYLGSCDRIVLNSRHLRPIPIEVACVTCQRLGRKYIGHAVHQSINRCYICSNAVTACQLMYTARPSCHITDMRAAVGDCHENCNARWYSFAGSIHYKHSRFQLPAGCNFLGGASQGPQLCSAGCHNDTLKPAMLLCHTCQLSCRTAGGR